MKAGDLRVHLSRTYLPDGIPPVEMAYRAWGVPRDDSLRAESTGLSVYATTSAEVGFGFVESIRDSDLALLPFNWREVAKHPDLVALAKRYSNDVSAAGKKLLVFFNGDSSDPLPLKNAIVCRTSMFRRSQNGDLPLPAWGYDTVGLLLGGKVSPLPLEPIPSVGFCGFAGYRLPPTAPWHEKGRALLRCVYRGMPKRTVRERALAKLKEDRRVADDFILRQHFYSGVSEKPEESREKQMAHLEFRRNVLGNAYTLCARGGGNFSFRFFEVLAMGRTPLLIDTDCVLPFESQIPYNDLIVRVDESRIDQVADTLVDFHEALETREFVERQRARRHYYDQWLSPLGFFSQLPGILTGLVGD